MPYLSDLAITSAIPYATLSDRRRNHIRPQLPLIGLDPGERAYEDGLYPLDAPARRPDLAKHQSTCCVLGNVGLREIQVDDDRLWVPADFRGAGRFPPGYTGKRGTLTFISMEVEIARSMGAWVTPDAGTRPLPVEGDLVIDGNEAPGAWAKPPTTFRGSHIYTVIGVDAQASGDSYLVHSVDGGQPGIRVRTRALSYLPNGELWARHVADDGAASPIEADGRPARGKRVQGWIDLDLLRCR